MVGKRRGIGVYPSHPVLGRTQGTIITSTFLFCICQRHLLELLFTVNRLKLSFIIRAFSDKERTHCVWKHGDSQGFQHASLISSKQLRQKEVLRIVFKWGLILHLSFLKKFLTYKRLHLRFTTRLCDSHYIACHEIWLFSSAVIYSFALMCI